jgi:hypothetical protein
MFIWYTYNMYKYDSTRLWKPNTENLDNRKLNSKLEIFSELSETKFHLDRATENNIWYQQIQPLFYHQDILIDLVQVKN